MTAATEGRNTKRRTGTQASHLVNTGATVFAGTLVTLLAASGKAVPAGTAAAGPAVGVAEDTVLGDGVAQVKTTRGTFQFANSASTDLIAAKDIGSTCYIVDDSTVALTDNSAARKAAGKIVDVDANGVWVEVG